MPEVVRSNKISQSFSAKSISITCLYLHTILKETFVRYCEILKKNVCVIILLLFCYNMAITRITVKL